MWNDRFENIFTNFTTPSASDGGKKDDPDEDAREQHKDGAIPIASTGTPLRGAVKKKPQDRPGTVPESSRTPK